MVSDQSGQGDKPQGTQFPISQNAGIAADETLQMRASDVLQEDCPGGFEGRWICAALLHDTGGKPLRCRNQGTVPEHEEEHL